MLGDARLAVEFADEMLGVCNIFQNVGFQINGDLPLRQIYRP